MKTEKRDIYIAEDGKEFTDKFEAMRYERVYKLVKHSEEDDHIYWPDTTAEEVFNWLLDRYEVTPREQRVGK